MNSTRTARLRVLAIPVLLGGLLSGCSAFGGEHITDLQLGDCFSVPDPSADANEEITNVEIVPCEEAHRQEVFALKEMPAGDFPGLSSLEAEAQEYCAAEFEGYVGRAYDLSELEASYLVPSQELWEDGDDRDIACTLGTTTGPEVSESYKDADI